MLTSNISSLKSILESENGVHLTAYLVNRGDLIDLKFQLQAILNESNDWLISAMSFDDRKKFLKPIETLLNSTSLLNRMKGNIGIFRTFDLLRVLNIPIDVEQSCQVATSFHVKPLLRWLQADRDFLLLGLEKESAYLYSGTLDSFKLLDSFLFPDSIKEHFYSDNNLNLLKFKQKRVNEDETFARISDWVNELTIDLKPKLFVAGEKSIVKGLNRFLKYSHLAQAPISDSFEKQNVRNICADIRNILKVESKKDLEKSLLEFKFAEEGNRTRKNIFQIAKAVVQGKVRKLIVTDELSIFGKIDKKTGGLALHPFDLDHEDDCIMDDLAQMVLSQGGEVVIAKRNEIPKGRPILAILDDDGLTLKKTEYRQAYEALQERFG